jgi:glycosyltransferase involved in cell wall biosynthesis
MQERLTGLSIETENLPLPALRPFDFPAGLRSIRYLRDFIRKNGIQLVYSNDSRAHWYAGIAAKMCGIPSVFHYRVSYSDGWLDKVQPRLCTRIVAVSNSVAKRFHGFGHKLSVIPNGVDVGRFQPMKIVQKWALSLAGKTPVIGTVARLEKAKGIDTFIQAVALLKKEFPRIGAVIVGKGEEKAGLDRLVGEMGLKENVLFLDDHAKIEEFMAMIDVYALLSDNEGMSRSILEAMACAKPVVATRVGGNPEVVEEGKTGRLVPYGEPEAAAEAIAGILRNAAKSEEMGKAARERAVARFSIEKHVQRMEKVFEEVMG